MIDENFIHNAITSGIRSVCLSIDGLEKTHDFIRRSGSFNKSIKALNKVPIKAIKKETASLLASLFFFRPGSGHFTNARDVNKRQTHVSTDELIHKYHD